MSSSVNSSTMTLLRIIGIGILAFFAALLFLEHNLDFFGSSSPEPIAITPRGDLSDLEKSTIKIFQNTSPSVVNISTVARQINPWTRDITRIPKGSGTGFFWNEKGYIVTNYHVLEGASEAWVRLKDQTTLRAALVGASPEYDLAVLKITTPFEKNLPIPLGTSHDLQVGQSVFAIGNPFGLDHTLTTGVISALNRSIEASPNQNYQELIQTDAAVNPGNSGGPLLDSSGRLIGINTAIYSPSGASAGIGFAVPVDIVNRIVPKLIAKGAYVRPVLGIGSDNQISFQVTRDLGIKGLLILEVKPGYPADKAGLKGSLIDENGTIVPGDIIQAIGNKPVTNMESLLDGLSSHEPGDAVQLKIWRKGEILDIKVTLN